MFFAEPRSSDIDVAQAVGRAIRKNPNHDRPALIVLALTVDDSLDAETVIDISQFKKARQVLLALQSHDPSIGADLTRLWGTLGETGPGDSDSVHTDLVDILIPTDLPSELAEQFLRAFSVHTVDTLTQQWEDNFAALAAYAAAHGHASPPQQYTTADGRPWGNGYPDSDVPTVTAGCSRSASSDSKGCPDGRGTSSTHAGRRASLRWPPTPTPTGTPTRRAPRIFASTNG